MTTTQAREYYHAKYLKARAEDRLAQSDRFLDAVSKLEEGESIPLTDLEAWVDKKNKLDLEEMSVRQLRHIARGLAIAKYTYFSREVLIMKIKNVRQAQGSLVAMSHLEDGQEDGRLLQPSIPAVLPATS